MRLKDVVDERMAGGDRAILKTVRKWKTALGSFSAFFFRSEVCRGADVPVYAVMGLPRGEGPFPGILHYHGGGQTANPELVELLVRQGYAAISFDWTGPRENREHVTRWHGCVPRYSGMEPDESLLIRALTAGRQALTILAEHPRVDSARLGQFGISWGGFQTWLLNAMDNRLRAAVAMYGCGITRSQALSYFTDELKLQRNFDPEAWLERFNPINYASDQQAPVLFLNGTNDFFGWMNTFRRLAGRLDERHRAAFAPHLNHAIGTLNPTFLAWLNGHLRGGGFPGQPIVSGKWTRHGVELRSAALSHAKSAVFYVASAHDVGPDSFWMPVVAQRSGGYFTARIAAAALSSRQVLVYAHQHSAHGIETSSFPLHLTGTPRPAPVFEGGPLPLTSDLWYGPASVDPLCPFIPLRPHPLRNGNGPAWKTASDLNFSFNTRVVALTRYCPRTGAYFRCRLHGPVTDPVIVAVLQFAGSPRERHFQGGFSRVALARGVPLGTLKDSRDDSLPAGTPLSHLCICGTTQRPGTVRLEAAEIVRSTNKGSTLCL